MLDSIARHLKPGGHLLLVVPSLESAHYTNFRLIQWNLREGFGDGEAVRAGFKSGTRVSSRQVRQGIVDAGGTLTKHFLREELQVLLGERGLAVRDFLKVEYAWRTEFSNPPRWLREPYPWDWLVHARKER